MHDSWTQVVSHSQLCHKFKLLKVLDVWYTLTQSERFLINSVAVILWLTIVLFCWRQFLHVVMSTIFAHLKSQDSFSSALNNYAGPLINPGKLCIDYFHSLEVSFWKSLPSKLMWLSLFVNAHWHSTYCVGAFVILTSVILCLCAAPRPCFIQIRFPTTTYLTFLLLFHMFLLHAHHILPLKITVVNNLFLNSYCRSKGSTCW